ncbi:MAG: SCO family protein [Hyphomicrobiales bacterium]|nr:SCO family protein [Hyphomicrobiales bacterium]
MRLSLFLLALSLVIAPADAYSQSIEEKALALSEAAIGKNLPELTFVDTQDNNVTLAELRGKPLLISLIYTGCTDTCPVIIEKLHQTVEVAQEALGWDSFVVVTIGFDARHDTPDRMRSFARMHGVDLPNWLFLSGSQVLIQNLADATGFTFVPSAGGFDHTSQITVVDAEGKIYQQIRGEEFDSPTIVEPLKDLLFGQRRSILSLNGLKERVKLFCTVFNPNTGRYYFNYSLLIGITIALACLLLVLTWLIREFRHSGQPGGGARS